MPKSKRALLRWKKFKREFKSEVEIHFDDLLDARPVARCAYCGCRMNGFIEERERIVRVHQGLRALLDPDVLFKEIARLLAAGRKAHDAQDTKLAPASVAQQFPGERFAPAATVNGHHEEDTASGEQRDQRPDARAGDQGSDEAVSVNEMGGSSFAYAEADLQSVADRLSSSQLPTIHAGRSVPVGRPIFGGS
jgi:hypothetical protein